MSEKYTVTSSGSSRKPRIGEQLRNVDLETGWPASGAITITTTRSRAVRLLRGASPRIGSRLNSVIGKCFSPVSAVRFGRGGGRSGLRRRLRLTGRGHPPSGAVLDASPGEAGFRTASGLMLKFGGGLPLVSPSSALPPAEFCGSAPARCRRRSAMAAGSASRLPRRCYRAAAAAACATSGDAALASGIGWCIAFENDQHLFEARPGSRWASTNISLETAARPNRRHLAHGQAFREDPVVAGGEEPLAGFDLLLVLHVVDQAARLALALERALGPGSSAR